MSILITGGMGFLGKRLAKKLVNRDDIIIFSREGDFELEKSGATIVKGDIKNKNELESAFMQTGDVDVVYHLAANLDESDKMMFKDNVLGTANLADLCRKHKAGKIIYMSSCGVTGYGSVSAEDSPYRPNTLYEKSKAESEKIIISSAVPYTIIRAPIIIGPNSIWLRIIQAAKKGYPIIGSGKNHFHLAYVSDVIDLLLLVKDNQKAENHIFNVATTDVKTYKEVYELICRNLGIDFREKHVPVWFAKLLAFMHETKSRIIGKKPDLIKMRSSINRLVVERVVSIEKAKKILDYEPKYSTSMAIDETMNYFRYNNML